MGKTEHQKMSVEVWQAEPGYRGVLLELRRNYSQQEANRERQFARLLNGLESRLSRLDVGTAEELKQQELIRKMLDPIVKNAASSGEREAAKAKRPQRP